jgi:hypothetical protein
VGENVRQPCNGDQLAADATVDEQLGDVNRYDAGGVEDRPGWIGDGYSPALVRWHAEQVGGAMQGDVAVAYGAGVGNRHLWEVG